jgi:hypothetical protein
VERHAGDVPKAWFGAGNQFEFAVAFALIWRKDNVSTLLARFVADVKLLPEVEAFTRS